MSPAFQKDEDLLNDVRRAINRGGCRLWWLGQSGFLVARAGRLVVLDPYLSDSLTRKYAGTDKPHTRMTECVLAPEALAGLGAIQAITSSHNHTDHLDAETLRPMLSINPEARLVIPAANREFVLDRLGKEFGPQLVEADAGNSGIVDGVEFHGIPAAHPTVERDAHNRCRFLGYVVRWPGLTIYHSGDTLCHEGLIEALRPFKIDLALLPINGDRPERKVAGNLDGTQAARLANAIGARCVIPCHFDLFEFNTASPEEFVQECSRLDQPCKVLRNGEGWEVAGAG